MKQNNKEGMFKSIYNFLDYNRWEIMILVPVILMFFSMIYKPALYYAIGENLLGLFLVIYHKDKEDTNDKKQ